MRKLLLATCATAAIGFAGDAKAINFDEVVAAALSFNYGEVGGLTGSIITSDTAIITGSVVGNRGVTQTNQNAGAGSLLQNSAAVAVVDGVNVTSGLFSQEDAYALAIAGNVGQVYGGNITLGGTSGAGMSAAVTGNLGVTQVNQNAGAGSLLQNSAALAAVGFCDTCPSVDLAVSVAAAGNYGTVHGYNLAGFHAGGALMAGSVNANEGLTQVSQNAGAGSVTQNAVALGALLPQSSTSPFNIR